MGETTVDKDFKKNTTGAMIKVLRMHRNNCEKKVVEYGLYSSQHKMLMYLYRFRDAPPTQVKIAQFFAISPAAVAVAVKKLEKDGYIIRTPRENDLRNNEVRLTRKGVEIAQMSMGEYDRSDDIMYRGMSEEDIVRLRGYLDKMLSNLEGGNK